MFVSNSRLRKKTTPFLEDPHRVLCVPGPREKKVISLYDTESQTYLLVLDSLLKRQTIPYCEDEDIGGGNSWKYSAT